MRICQLTRKTNQEADLLLAFISGEGNCQNVIAIIAAAWRMKNIMMIISSLWLLNGFVALVTFHSITKQKYKMFPVKQFEIKLPTDTATIEIIL